MGMNRHFNNTETESGRNFLLYSFHVNGELGVPVQTVARHNSGFRNSRTSRHIPNETTDRKPQRVIFLKRLLCFLLFFFCLIYPLFKFPRPFCCPGKGAAGCPASTP